MAWGKERLAKYPVCLQEYWLKDNGVNPYCFIDELSNYTKEGDNILVIDTGGGTIDFTILKTYGELFEIIHSEGNNTLGGNNFTQIILVCAF